MRFAKIISAAAAILTVSLCGCSIKFGTNTKPDNNYLVAKPADSALSEKLGVTYAEFMNDYQYYLEMAGIEDDEAENTAETCKSRRRDIIESLILEKICLLKAEEYGVLEITEEEDKQVKANADAIINERINYFASKADFGTADPSTITDEQKKQRGGELLDKALAQYGFTREDYYEKQKRYLYGFKVMKALGETLDRAEAEKIFDDRAALGKETYENSPAEYEQSVLSQYYIPEGSRYIKHILLGFSEDKQKEISSLRLQGDKEGADKLREEQKAALDEKLNEVLGKLDAGEDWDAVSNAYTADKAGNTYYPDGYIVIPKGTNFMEEFQEAAFVPEKIGDRTICVTDYGVHIMLYASDAKITDSDRKAAVDSIFAQQTQQEFSKKMQEWIEEYGFYDNMDYEILRLDKPTDETSN